MRVFYEVAPLHEHTYNGTLWRWEERPIGPRYWPIRKDGEPYERLPANTSDFWRALEEWKRERE